MYVCLECGRSFHEDDVEVVKEYHYELEDRAYEKRHICPYCKSANFEEGSYCQQCGDEISESQAKFGLCADCEIEADEKFKELLEEYFTKNEIEYLNNQYCDEYFGLD